MPNGNNRIGETMVQNVILNEIQDVIKQCNTIKYAAYRTSAKLRVIQKNLLMDKVPLKVIDGVFERYQFQKIDNGMKLSQKELEPLVSDIYFVVFKEHAINIEKEVVCESLISLLLNIYDKEGKNEISVLDCKFLLALTCRGKPREKYLYMFHQLSDHNNCLSKKKLKIFLNNLIDVIEFVGESKAFGKHLINGTIESCFGDFQNSKIGISEENFIYWLTQDPQLLVWISIMYRMEISESVSHKMKCGICKIFPIIGLCYKCLRCMSYNMCQTCFFTGKLKKGHKLRHPIQEYCHPVSTHQSAKAFFLTVKNILYRTNSTCQYLPAVKIDSFDGENLNDGTKRGEETNPPVVELQMKEFENVLLNLQIESEKLIPQIEVLCELLETSKIDTDPAEVKRRLVKHKIRIENQIERLKTLKDWTFESKTKVGKPKVPIASTPVVKNFLSESKKRKKFHGGLENLSPIRVIDFSASESDESNKKLDKRLLWDNYDLGNEVIKDSWEELKGDEANGICPVTVRPKSKTNSNGCDSLEIGRRSESRNINLADSNDLRSSPRHSFGLENSEKLSQGGFTWLREENDGGTGDESVTSLNKSLVQIESGFKELESDLKQTLGKLRSLSSDLNAKDEENKSEVSFREVDNVDSLLMNLIRGIDKFIGE